MRIGELPLPDPVKELLLSFGISLLYPPQEDAIKAGALERTNLILASPTASGKTLVAELCAMKHIIEWGGKVLYLTPLKALTSEKFDEFSKYKTLKKQDGQNVRVAISTGDYDGSDPWLGKYDVIITTNEKCDSLIRHRSSWLRDVTLVVTDEIHTLIDSERGPTLEVTLTRLMETNPKAQILALSATINNPDEIATWFRAKSVATEWRPVDLIEGVYLPTKCRFNDGASITIEEESKYPVIDLALHTIRNGGQSLIFNSTRRRAVAHAKRASNLVKKLLSKTEQTVLDKTSQQLIRVRERTRLTDLLAELVKKGVAFHHAGLAAPHRKIIEDTFRSGRIKMISATPTLAAGVNLPARMVVIADSKRYVYGYGLDEISVLEYKQMAGRAGRPKYDKIGEAVLISRTEDELEYLMERYVFSKPEKIWSKLAIERILRSHVLASIASGFNQSKKSLMSFFKRTFYAHQFDSEVIVVLVTKILKYLFMEEMIVINGKSIRATRFGRRVSELYIDPVSGAIIRDGILKATTDVSNLGVLSLVCHTPDVTPKHYPRRKELDDLTSFVKGHAEEFLFPFPNEENSFDFNAFLGEIKCACVLEAWIQELSEDGIGNRYGIEPGDLFRLINSVTWLLFGTHELAKLFGQKNLLLKVSKLQRRVEKGVKEELLALIGLDGVGRVRGRTLYNAGYRTLTSLERASVTQLSRLPLIGTQIAKRIKKQVRRQ